MQKTIVIACMGMALLVMGTSLPSIVYADPCQDCKDNCEKQYPGCKQNNCRCIQRCEESQACKTQ